MKSEEKIAQRSEELFRQGLYCAESVLLAMAEYYGVKSDLIPRIATGFCSGMARTSGLCGAVSGGIMGISLQYGRCSPKESVEPSYHAIRTFLTEFERRFGSTNCSQLLGCRLDTPEGQCFFRENNLREKCQMFTREAAKMAAAAINSQSKQQ